MASLPSRAAAAAVAGNAILSASYNAEHNQMVGAAGIFNGGTTGIKLLVKTSDASDPPIECDQVGVGPLAEWKQNTILKVSITNAGLFNMVNTGVNTGLNADQVDGIEGANIAKLDTHKTAFSVGWFIDDPSTLTVGDESLLPVWIVPAGVSIAVTKIKIVFYGGSHTAGGAVQFVHIQRNAAGGGAALITDLSLNNTNNTIRTTYSANFAANLSEGDQIGCRIESRSGTITERKVSIALIGTQKFTT